jgi:elongation factor G
MLTLTLRNLERDGLLRRTVYPTVPPKVEYERTDTARELHQSPLSLLEPVVEVTVTVPEDAVGAVLGDLAVRRGRVTGSVTRAGAAVVTATVPLAELFGYATRLRSRTQGRGAFTARPTGYAPTPASVTA